MIVERTEHPSWLSNAYLVADRPGGHGVLVDGNGIVAPLRERAERDEVALTHILLTHGHGDHVEGVDAIAAELGIPILRHPALAEGDVVRSGELEIRVLETPGHSPDHLAFAVNGECLTGDLIFRRTVGGTRGGGPTGFGDLRRSIDRILALPAATVLRPGHREATTVDEEREENPFVRVWRGADPEGDEPCTVGGRSARLLLWAPDYDGGHKAWVRFADGSEAVVGGSQVERRA